MHNVLIFPAGSEIGLEIFQSLKYSHHVNLFGASGKSDHASFVYSKETYIENPALYIDSPDFLAVLNEILLRLNINFIYPTHDEISLYLSAHRSEISATVITSSFETNRIARFKRETYRVFEHFDFCPKIHACFEEEMTFPVFLKPNNGQGGQGAVCVNTPTEAAFYLDKNPKLLVMEFLPGLELSVDCFSDFQGNLLFIGPRTRERVQMGISFRSSIVPLTDEIFRIAHAIHSTVALRGAWFFQVKQDASGSYKLLEFAPRQSSTMGVYRYSGVNFALLSLFDALNIPVSVSPNIGWVQLDRRLACSFKSDIKYKRVYIDFDETLVVGSMVHPMVLAFVYQCRNRSIPVILVTKHSGNIFDSLRQCAISENLFEAIIHVQSGQDKWQQMVAESSIFIDNCWHERLSVKNQLGIPVFDVDAVECLIVSD